MVSCIPLIYTYRHTADDGRELRWSLRSVDQNLHLRDMGPVCPVVVGDEKPSWLDERVFVPSPPEARRDPGVHRVSNQVHNFIAGIRHLYESGMPAMKFLLMNDDFILLEHRHDVLNLHHIDWATFARNVERTGRDMEWYRVATRATSKWVQHCPEPRYSWELHAPMWMKLDRASALFHSMVANEPADAMPFPRTTYGCLVGYPDEEIVLGWDPLSLSRSMGTSWISTNEDKTRVGLFEMVSRRLTRPSRWEVTAQ